MKRHIMIYKACVQTVFSRAAAYRSDFIMGCIITFISNLLFPFITVLIYRNGASFPEWSMWEVLLIQSLYTLSMGISAAIFQGIVWSTMSYIREGSFEVVLLKPISTLFYLAGINFNLESIGLIIGGMVMAGVSLYQIGTASILQWFQFVILFIAGIAVLNGFFLIMAAITFKWVGNSRIPEIFDSIKTFGRYPASIFPKVLQVFTAFVIPVGMISFSPASALLGRINFLTFLAVIPCFLFMYIGIWLYQKMIKLYEGVGG